MVTTMDMENMENMGNTVMEKNTAMDTATGIINSRIFNKKTNTNIVK